MTQQKTLKKKNQFKKITITIITTIIVTQLTTFHFFQFLNARNVKPLCLMANRR